MYPHPPPTTPTSPPPLAPFIEMLCGILINTTTRGDGSFCSLSVHLGEYNFQISTVVNRSTWMVDFLIKFDRFLSCYFEKYRCYNETGLCI